MSRSSSNPPQVAELTKGEAAQRSGRERCGAVAPAGALAAAPATGSVDASGASTIDMLELIDSPSDEVANLLRDLVSETVS